MKFWNLILIACLISIFSASIIFSCTTNEGDEGDTTNNYDDDDNDNEDGGNNSSSTSCCFAFTAGDGCGSCFGGEGTCPEMTEEECQEWAEGWESEQWGYFTVNGSYEECYLGEFPGWYCDNCAFMVENNGGCQ